MCGKETAHRARPVWYRGRRAFTDRREKVADGPGQGRQGKGEEGRREEAAKDGSGTDRGRCRRCSPPATRAAPTSSASARRRPARAGCSTNSPSIPASGCRRSRNSTTSTAASASCASPGRCTSGRRGACARPTGGGRAPMSGRSQPEDIGWLEARMWLHRRPLDLDLYARLFNLRGERLSGDICPPYAILPEDEARAVRARFPAGADRLSRPRAGGAVLVAVLHDPPPPPAGGAGIARDGAGVHGARHRPEHSGDPRRDRALAARPGRPAFRTLLLRRAQGRRGRAAAADRRLPRRRSRGVERRLCPPTTTARPATPRSRWRRTCGTTSSPASPTRSASRRRSWGGRRRRGRRSTGCEEIADAPRRDELWTFAG